VWALGVSREKSCEEEEEKRSRSQQATGKMAEVWMGRSARCTRRVKETERDPERKERIDGESERGRE